MLVSGGDHLRCSRNQDDVINPAQIAGVFNNGTIAVQKQSGAARRQAPYDLAPDTL
jgi:hypothetical protein